MTSLLRLRVANETFAQVSAFVLGWALISVVSALVATALLLSILNPVWTIAVTAGVVGGWVILGAVTYRFLRTPPA
jgi:uncharacterized membrane protein